MLNKYWYVQAFYLSLLDVSSWANALAICSSWKIQDKTPAFRNLSFIDFNLNLRFELISIEGEQIVWEVLGQVWSGAGPPEREPGQFLILHLHQSSSPLLQIQCLQTFTFFHLLLIFFLICKEPKQGAVSPQSLFLWNFDYRPSSRLYPIWKEACPIANSWLKHALQSFRNWEIFSKFHLFPMVLEISEAGTLKSWLGCEIGNFCRILGKSLLVAISGTFWALRFTSQQKLPVIPLQWNGQGHFPLAL